MGQSSSFSIGLKLTCIGFSITPISSSSEAGAGPYNLAPGRDSNIHLSTLENGETDKGGGGLDMDYDAILDSEYLLVFLVILNDTLAALI